MNMLFKDLSGTANLWIHTADRRLTDAEAQTLQQRMMSFSTDWTSHGRGVDCQWELVDQRLLLLAAEVPSGDLSGCGIDKSLHAIQAFSAEAGFSWVDGLSIVYRGADGRIQVATRPAFRELVRDGHVSESTQVIDTSLRILDEARTKGLERSAGNSWHARFLRVAV